MPFKDSCNRRIKVFYLLTTFPVLSETFIQREIRSVSQQVDLKLYSLWGGARSWEGLKVHRFPKWKLLLLFWFLPYWFMRKPFVFLNLTENLLKKAPPSLENGLENLLGFAFGLIYAHSFIRQKPDHIHANWATMPATAGWIIYRLTGIPFSHGAHAYDIYENGGDWLLSEKFQCARFVHTTTQSAYEYLVRSGCDANRILLIRRGLNNLERMPQNRQFIEDGAAIHLLSVGRLVEKKGYFFQLQIYRKLKDCGIKFQAHIIGFGPLYEALLDYRQELDLEDCVIFCGQQTSNETLKAYLRAHAFIFTGIIASNGDRDGLPNVIPEAMAMGVPVLTSPVSGTTEAIVHRETGWVIEVENQDYWIQCIRECTQDLALRTKVIDRAHNWVKTHFDADKNALTLVSAMRKLHEA